MDGNETKNKVLKVVSVALPILLVAFLAVMIVIALDLARELDSRPVVGTGVSDNGGEGEIPPPDENGENPEDDEPVEDFFSEGLEYESFGDGTCALAGIGECSDTYIIVPAESPDGDIVIEVAGNAFKNCNKIKGIEFPETLTEIGAYAFYGSTLKSVKIGAQISEIGSYAFAGCKSLTEIDVDEDNEAYSSSSGVLYNKSGSVLITYPAGKSDNFCIISNDVQEIANMAFYKCTSIKKVTYHGTEAQWQQIEIGAGNDAIEEAILFCAGSAGK